MSDEGLAALPEDLAALEAAFRFGHRTAALCAQHIRLIMFERENGVQDE
jgi:hypothetical protein